VLLNLALAAPSMAQQTSTFGGVNPRDIKFTPIDTTKALAVPIPSVQSPRFSLLNFFPRISLPSFLTSPHVGVSPLPPVSSFPSTHYKNSFQPLPPFTPGGG
jgi:hypothetical protein